MDVSQPIWLSDCPEKGRFSTKLHFFSDLYNLTLKKVMFTLFFPD